MKGTILCVDDEPIVLQSLKAELRRRFAAEFRLESAEGVEEAMEVLAELGEDEPELVVISDWLMPGMRGDQFLSQVATTHPNAVLILLTGQADQDVVQRARGEGRLEDCIHKPWREDRLREAITRGLARRRSA